MGYDTAIARITEIRQEYTSLMSQKSPTRAMPMGGPEVFSTASIQTAGATGNSGATNLVNSGLVNSGLSGSTFPGLEGQAPGINFGDLLSQEIARVTGPAAGTGVVAGSDAINGPGAVAGPPAAADPAGSQIGDRIVSESKKMVGRSL